MNHLTKMTSLTITIQHEGDGCYVAQGYGDQATGASPRKALLNLLKYWDKANRWWMG